MNEKFHFNEMNQMILIFILIIRKLDLRQT